MYYPLLTLDRCFISWHPSVEGSRCPRTLVRSRQAKFQAYDKVTLTLKDDPRHTFSARLLLCLVGK